MKKSSRILCLVPAALLAIGALLSSGCASWVRTPPPGAEVVVVETENIYVTGSHIPVQVPKSATARAVPTISPLTILTQDDVRRMGGPGPAPMH